MAEDKFPVCRDCGEAFSDKDTAKSEHGKRGCDGGGYKMTKESEAW